MWPFSSCCPPLAFIGSLFSPQRCVPLAQAVSELEDLQGNEVVGLPLEQLAGFSKLTNLAPETIRMLILRVSLVHAREGGGGG